MSRYGGDYSPRGPPTERWDASRFERERGGRQSQTIERDRFEERDRYSGGSRRRESSADDFQFKSRPARGGYEEDRFFSEQREERYGPPARRYGGGGGGGRERRYYEEEEEIDSFESSPARRGGYEDRGGGGPRRAPPRPGMLIRRQSSLDTFDRKPMPRYGPGRPRTPPEVITMPAPGRRRRSPPNRYYERDYEDIGVAEPDRFGEGDFRGWREREVETIRRKKRDSGEEKRFEEFEEFEGVEEEKPFPRKGRTKMTSRLVNKRAIIELGYPFEDEITREGEFVIILKALNKELIDEVLFKSKEFNERDSRERTTYMIEAPPPPREPETEIIREIIVPKPPSEVPRSVREWDVMSGAVGSSGGHGGRHGSVHESMHEPVHESVHKSTHGGKSHGGKSHASKSHASKSHAGRSTHGGHSHHGGDSEHGHSTIKGGGSSSSSSSSSEEVIIERKPSRSRSKHRRHKSAGYEVEEVGESNHINTGPLALVLPHRSKSRRNSRDERKIKEEIRELEAEKERLKKERRHEKKYHKEEDEDEVIIERVREGRHKEKNVKIEKDRRAPDSKTMKALLATLT